LVFDYFTALPMQHAYLVDQFDINAANAMEDWMPTVDQGGLRVHGRVDINSAPWRVLSGVPMAPMSAFGWPNRVKASIRNSAGLDDNKCTPIGEALAKAIVGYREARRVGMSADFSVSRFRSGTGFLTVGELANVRAPSVSGGLAWNISGDHVSTGAERKDNNDEFLQAAARLIAMGDWVTTRSDVFTIYGTLRGAGRKSFVDRRAIRFQETVDRLRSLQTNRLPRRIGPRVIEPYVVTGAN